VMHASLVTTLPNQRLKTDVENARLKARFFRHG